MGGSYPGPEKMADVLKAMEKNFPGAIRAISGEQMNVAKTQADVDAAVSPIYAQSNMDLYKKYGPEMNRIGSEIDSQNQRAASQTEVGIAKDYGSQLTKLADELQRGLDPEFYKNRASIGKGNEKLLASIDPTKLTGSEIAELESSIARTGGFANPNDSMRTVSNAMQFGSAGNAKKQGFAQILNSVASTLPALRSGISGFEVATRRALTPNSGDARTATTQTNTGQNAWATGNNMMAQATQLQAIKAQKSKDFMDKLQQGVNIANSGLQAVGSIAGMFAV